jgi:dTDP-4-dehydrorhamnose 3,5-epimerase-like enzyme
MQSPYKSLIPSITDAKLIEIPKISDERGSLSVLEQLNHVPFDIKRIFYLYDIAKGQSRGAHAHKECHHFMIAISGSFDVLLDDGRRQKTITLSSPDMGLYVPPMIWDEELNFSEGAVCLVLTSHPYDENDYIRSYDRYLGMQAPF